jgi:hypothetical protein
MNRPLPALLVCSALAWAAPAAPGAELILPQNRNAYYSSEPIEFAVAGLKKDATATVELIPQDQRLAPVTFDVKGDGSTAAVTLPPFALAPSGYAVKLDGKSAANLTVSAGVNRSTMLLSQTIGWDQLKASGGNFILGNAFSFGELDPEGRPLKAPRGHRSPGLDAFERAVAMDLPTVVYMYWTGYVTHKPWGSEKSWADKTMGETMRLFSLHTAQYLRRYGRNIVSVGTLDEPGLAWGRTPAGGTTTGFPNWDEKDWYEAHGWQYTDDPASRPDDDWMKYMTVRCRIIAENDAQARRDLRSVWPDVVFSTDLYAPHAVMDGTDPLNQQVNDFPSSHVFLDWGSGKLGALSGIYLEKAHEPTSRLAHAMNGQLFGTPVPQPQQRYAYRLMLNAMLAAGLRSNWWLNTGNMGKEDLAAVNEPVQRLGPLFLQMTPTGHDVAVLWSFTEICRREKDITAREAKKKPGSKLLLRVTSLPESSAIGKEGKEIEVSAYTVGNNYQAQVLAAHQALARAGYPAHIVHEKRLPRGVLKNYRTLVIVGQTFDLTKDVRTAVADFTAAGGKVVVDRTTTVSFPGALVTEANFKDPYDRWAPLFLQDPKTFKSAKEASYFQTNFFMDGLVRDAVGPLKETLRKTGARPAVVTDSVHLAAERHEGGEGALTMVLNGFEQLPDIPDDQKYQIYNYAPYDGTVTLRDVKPDQVVYLIEGGSWQRVTRVAEPAKPQALRFEPGEMKLYLIAPRVPAGLDLAGEARANVLTVRAAVRDLKMPWPLTVTVKDADGRELYRVHRATAPDGRYSETFPLGGNVKAGDYSVSAVSAAGELSRQVLVPVRPEAAGAAVEKGKARVFDAPAIREFFAARPEVVVAFGPDSRRKDAERLAGDLAGRGVKVRVAPEKELVHKVRYPRVWDPYIKVHEPAGEEKKPQGMSVKLAVTLETGDDGRAVAKADGGKDLGEDWRKPGTQATVAGQGFIDFGPEQFYEPGCVLYVDDKGQVVVVKGRVKEVKATEEVRRKWSRPWARLSSYLGTDHLPPQLPEAYAVDEHLILLGDGEDSELVAALQASDLLLETADARYPGPGKALVSFAWSPFGLGKNVILIGASDDDGLAAGRKALVDLLSAPGGQ